MKISKEQIERFKLIYKQEFDIELSDQTALEYAKKLIGLVAIVSREI